MDFLVVVYIPIFTALIGWLTNKVAIKMLFRPRRPFRVFGVLFQGLIPRRQEEIAARTAEIIEQELITHHFFREKIKKIDLGPYMREFAGKLVRDGIGERLRGLPLIGSFINESTLGTLESIAAEELAIHATALTEKLGDEAEQHMEVGVYVEEQIKAFDLEKLESVIHRVASKEFRTIELLGGVLGFAVGLGQLTLLWLTGNLNLAF